MFWMFVLAVVLGAVFFKLGVYSVVFGLVGFVAKVLFVVSGASILVGVGGGWRGGGLMFGRRRGGRMTVGSRRGGGALSVVAHNRARHEAGVPGIRGNAG